MRLSSTLVPPLGPRVAWRAQPAHPWAAGDLVLRSGREARWWLWLRESREADTVIHLRSEHSGRGTLAAADRGPGWGAGAHALVVPHEQWTSLSVRRAFAHGSFEAGLEGLASEPMAAIDRRGRGPAALRRAGGMVGLRIGRPERLPTVWTVALERDGCARVQPTMRVRSHARRWLGHGQRPVMDVRWRADGALMAVCPQRKLVAQLRGTATWRHVVGERGQVLQVGSFPQAAESPGPTPHVLYEPIAGHEDLARYTAHVFSTVLRAEVRLGEWALGAFCNATQIDHPHRANRDLWLWAAGPTLATRLPVAGRSLMLRVQSARRWAAQGSPWLHLVTVGA